jgi:lipopolysaccharide export system protein LptA
VTTYWSRQVDAALTKTRWTKLKTSMPLKIYRLRRWLAVIAVLFTAVVAGMYFYARLRQHSVLGQVPGKISYDIKQTASGFQFSKSEAGRTVFTIRAKDVKEFKLNGRADLHDVSIVLYGRDTSRFDQIYGDDFTFDPKSGNVTAKGLVQIDLEANPSGNAAPDQATPKELKNPIHLETTDLVFNRDSGDAHTDARVDFRTPQAAGWAVGVRYSAKSKTLTLASDVHLAISGENAANIFADHGEITREPRVITLDHPRMERDSGTLQSDEATFYLGRENEVERVVATGNVNATSKARPKSKKKSRKQIEDQDAEPLQARADNAELILESKRNLLRTATLTGNVHLERGGAQPMQGDAGSLVLDFVGQNVLQKAHASDGVKLTQRGGSGANGASFDGTSVSRASPTKSTPQDFDITAPVIDFFVADGRRLERAQTSGAAKIEISPAQNSKSPAPQRTVITAGRFDAKFASTPESKSRLTSIHGAPNAKIVSITPGAPDRISTSQTVDASFLAEGGIASITQQGSVTYTDGLPLEKRTQAFADKAFYTPADRILVLTGNPRVSDGGMTTTANKIRIDRTTDDAIAEGDVKSTYSELKEDPNGALLASSSLIHVTAETMTAHNSPATAIYEGNARLWQDANIINAPTIQFDRDRRSLVAQGTASSPVLTMLVQAKTAGTPPLQGEHKSNKKSEKNSGQTSPIAISAMKLTYLDADRKAHYEGGVTAKGTAFTATARDMEIYLQPRSQTKSEPTVNQPLSAPSKLDHLIAQGNVQIEQPGRRAEGQTLNYTASDDRFVITGGSPSIFDAEHGKITGVSLTFFRSDDRVLVEGGGSTPVVTQTRVTR